MNDDFNTCIDIARTIGYIIKGVETNQHKLINKAIRQHARIRKMATKTQLEKIISIYVPLTTATYSVLLEAAKKIPESNDTADMDVDGVAEGEGKKKEVSADVSSVPPTSILPEVEIYIFTTVVTALLRENLDIDAAYYCNLLVDRIRAFNRRSLDLLSAKAYFYFSLAYERIEKLENIRPTLLALYRTTCVRHDDMGQAVLENLILRNYLEYNLVEQAHTFSLRTTFPEGASNNQFCRFLYYIGRIQAIQLEYSESYQRLMLASRKAPQDGALGFNSTVQKLAIIVQLLMGEVPEKRIFFQKELCVPLSSYFELTQAVRNGDLQQFNAVVAKYETDFKMDKNLTLVHRLGHNVLKTGLRKISLSYSRIALADVASKLHLPSASSAEYICAKAIRDGVIEASVEHERGWLVSTEMIDVYSTEEPQNAFHK